MKTIRHIPTPSRINAVRKTAAALTALFAIFTASTLTSCVEDELYDTPHPDKGAVVVNADFSQRSTAAGTIPREYSLLHACCGAETAPYTMPATKAEVCPELFNPGNHTLIAWNECAEMTVGDGTVKVVETASGLIEPLPGYLFSARREIEVAADDTLHVVLPMAQRNRDLLIELTVTEGNPELISSVTGTITGVAGAFSLSEQKIMSDAANTFLTFTRTGDKLTANARLLGFAGTAPTLTLDVTFTDGRTLTVESGSFADAVKDFGGNMTETFVLTNSLKTPIEAGMSATIEDWHPGNNGGEDVDIR